MLGRLPKGDSNGLASVVHEMAAEPGKIRVAIVLFDADRVAHITDTGAQEVRARIRRMEVMSDPGDGVILERLLMRQFERRTGATTLPFDLEQDVRAVFDEVANQSPQPLSPDSEAANPGAEPSAMDRLVEPPPFTPPEPTWEGVVDPVHPRTVDDVDGDMPPEPEAIVDICKWCGQSIELAGEHLWVDIDGWPTCTSADHDNHAPTDEHEPEGDNK